MIRAIMLSITAALLGCAPAAAQTLAALTPQRPALRASATVTADVVRIGDLIDNAGVVANVPIFRAPDLGTTGTVSAAAVIDAVQAHAIIGLNPDGIDEVRVTRASRAIAIEDIESEIADTLTRQYKLGDAKNIVLRFDRYSRVIHVDPRASGELRTAQITYDARSGRFDTTVEIAGSQASRLRFTGVAIPSVNVLSLTRALARGEVIRQSDLAIERRARSEVTADMLIAAEQAVGRAARSALGPGRPLRAADLTKQELVQRNEIVTIIYEVPGITLTLRGKANESGGEGDVVEVVNIQSKRTVHGVVTGPGRVVASNLAASTIAANASGKLSQSTRAAARAQ